MAPAEEEDKPWRRAKEERLKLEQQAAQPPPLTDNQRDALEWYRNTCLVAGAGLIGSIWRQVAGGAAQHQVFVPPRAQGLPPEVVDTWRRNMRFKEGVRTVGRQTVFVTGVGALYFGAEVTMRRWRQSRDAWNTAAAGAVTGAYLGAISEWQQQHHHYVLIVLCCWLYCVSAVL